MNNKIKKAASSAPGKVILFGEHFVVYNNPAIVAAINKRIRVDAQTNDESCINIKSGQDTLSVPISKVRDHLEAADISSSFLYPILKCVEHVALDRQNPKLGLNLDIHSQVPNGEGLGSSAASCVATVGSLYYLNANYERNRVYETAKIMERNIHTNSSGIDCYVSTFGGIVNYEPAKGFSNIRPKNKFVFIIGTTGVKHSTGEIVTQVKRFREKNSSLFKDLCSKASVICNKAINSVLEGNESELGKMLTENHKLLVTLGVSHPAIEELIDICLDNGAIGAKLTGAGRGGAMIALIPSDTCKEISNKINRSPGKWMLAEFDYDGVLVE